MATHILVNKSEGTTHDVVSEPFPVHNSLIWVDITEYDPQPQSGWSAADNNGVYAFTPPYVPPIDKEAVLAAVRFEYENAGTTISFGEVSVSILTDLGTRTNILGARLMAQADSEFTLLWKTPNGFVTLTAAMIIVISDAILAHVKKAFVTEAAVLQEISGLNSEQAIRDRFVALFSA